MADNTNIKAIYELKIIIKFVLKLRIRLISVWGTLCISLNKVVMMALDCWEYGKNKLMIVWGNHSKLIIVAGLRDGATMRVTTVFPYSGIYFVRISCKLSK